MKKMILTFFIVWLFHLFLLTLQLGCNRSNFVSIYGPFDLGGNCYLWLALFVWYITKGLLTIFFLLSFFHISIVTANVNIRPIDDPPKKVFCVVCDKKVLRKFTRKKHMKTHTSSDRSDTCNICEKVFKIKSFSKSHICQYHRSQIYMWLICHKRFLIKLTLRRHMKILTDEDDEFKDKSVKTHLKI